MQRRTKYLLLGGGALLGLYWWTQRCDQDEIDLVAKRAVKVVAGMPASTAAQVLLERLPAEVPHLWTKCRPALLAAMHKAGMPAHIGLYITIALANQTPQPAVA